MEQEMMTETAQTVLIYGNSLFVADVAAELGAVPGHCCPANPAWWRPPGAPVHAPTGRARWGGVSAERC
jgi:hypothetical protein